MLSSRGEIKIHEILEAAGLVFREEYIFQDLMTSSGKHLRFDFAIFNDNNELEFLIEYQGVQHYEPKSKFGGYGGLRKQQYNDRRKRDYCKIHQIPLIIIPYWDEGRLDYDYIMNAAYKAGY